MLAHIVEKIKQHKEATHMTTQQIAEKSGVPASTISRILSGQTDSPNVHNLAAICRAVGVSLDELFGITLQEQPKTETAPAAPAVDHTAELTASYREQIDCKNGWIKRLFVLCVALMATFIALVFIDVLNGGIGFVRY